MSEQQVSAGVNALGDVARRVFQVGYVTRDGERARAAARSLFGVPEFEVMALAVDVLDDAGAKVDEIRIEASFALDRGLEIIEPVHDPIDLFAAPDPSRELLAFHHLGAFVEDLAPALAEAHAQSLPFVRLGSPVMEIAFIDLRAQAGHRLEILRPLAG